MAYRLLLGREPESAAVVEHHSRNASSLAELRDRFLLSAEFDRARVPKLPLALDRGEPMHVEVQAEPWLLRKMFARTEQTWQSLGKSDPFWSVLSSELFRKPNFDQNAAAFYESGRLDLDRLSAWLNRNGIHGFGPQHTCCEYGCGTGRVTGWLASRFSRVIACDISEPHLALAARHIEESGRGDVCFRHIESIETLNSLEAVDLIFSFLVLQHNPPPVMAFILEKLLGSLKPGGVAFFQVPTYHAAYRFVAGQYVDQPETGEIEVHFLPQREVYAIAEVQGCRVLEVQPDDMLGQPYCISDTFLLQKRG